jgi:poly(A) polymerase
VSARVGGASGTMMGEPAFPALVGQVREALAGQGEIYLVGGAVRDSYLRRPVTDLDFVAAGDGLDLAQRVARAMRWAFYPLDAERRVGRVLVEAGGRRSTLDFASQRGHSLIEDLSARDFTLNAVAVPLSDLTTAIDPLHGLEDLSTATLRACSPSSLRDDPLRTLRAVRLAVHLNLHIDPGTREWIRQAASGLPQVAAERIRDEFMRIMAGPKVAAALRVLQALGLLALVVPETAGLEQVDQPAPHVHDVWNHTLLLIDRLETLLGALAPRADEELSADLILGSASLRLGRFREALQAHFEGSLSGDRPVRGLVFLAALLHDVGKPETKRTEAEGEVHFIGHDRIGAEWAVRRAVQLHLSNVEADYLGCIVRNHMRPQQLSRERTLTRRAIYRFFAATGECGVDVAVIALADYLGIYGPTLEQDGWAAMLDTVRGLLESYFEHRAQHIEPALFISGDDVMQALNLRPGPQVGVLLEALREAQATGEVATREAALEFIRALQSRA